MIIPTNPNDYSREERYSQFEMLSRREKANSERRSGTGQKITLINILLIVLIMLIFIPRTGKPEHLTKHFRLGSYDVELQQSGVWLRLSIALDAAHKDTSGSAGRQSKEPAIAGWIIEDGAEEVIHQEVDIPPGPGERRDFEYELPAGLQVELQVFVNGQKRSVQF